MERNIRKKAKTVANLIHAKVLSDWSNECNVLVMQSLIVTSKVIVSNIVLYLAGYMCIT